VHARTFCFCTAGSPHTRCNLKRPSLLPTSPSSLCCVSRYQCLPAKCVYLAGNQVHNIYIWYKSLHSQVHRQEPLFNTWGIVSNPNQGHITECSTPMITVFLCNPLAVAINNPGHETWFHMDFLMHTPLVQTAYKRLGNGGHDIGASASPRSYTRRKKHQ
jgi:hypothetical protein